MQNTQMYQTDIEREADKLKEAIADLHARQSNDYQSLIKQAKKKVKVLNYNLAQLVSRRNWDNKDYQIIYDRWGRGTGKTTSIGGKLSYIAQAMPRSVGTFIAPSYKFLLTRIIPSIVNGLELHGFHQGLHYFIGQKPPRSWKWEKPYQPPSDFGKFIWFYTGAGVHLISQDVAGDGRGLNTDFELGDESALLDFAIMEECTTPTLRGSRISAFKDNPLFRKRFHHSSMPLTQTGRWIFDLEEKNMMGDKSALIIDASCKVNLHNLAPGYLEDAKRTALNDVIFNAEYLNIRPPTTGPDSFYPLFNENIHGYRSNDDYKGANNCAGDADLVAGSPIYLGVDFGSAVNYITVNQYLKSINELRTINEHYVKSQDAAIQDDAFEDFHNYYLPHQATCKDIYLCYDKTGNLSTGHTRKTRAEQAKEYLEKRGWRVVLLTKGFKNTDHALKFTMWEKIMTNTLTKLVHRNLPVWRINLIRCRTLVISIGNSKAKEGKNGEIHKDKTIEAKMLKKGEAEKSTHGTDALDTVPEALFSDVLRFGDAWLPS